jgi:PPM family protein phosphatase
MVAHLMPYKVLAFGLSDIGLVRQNNEDVWAQLPSMDFFVLADGMGGHQAGEIAAHETASILCKAVNKKIKGIKETSELIEIKDLLRRAIIYVNSAVYKMGRAQLELRGMGTTLCCMLFHRQGLVFAHVGDSRIYRLRGHRLEQLTKDHSLLRELVDQGQLDEQQATDFLYKNIITKAIGTEPKVDPTVEITDIAKNDIFLMCSDGLSDLLTIREIERTLVDNPSIQDAVENLIAQANEKGGRDNVTVVIAKVEGTDVSKDLSR